MTEDSLIRLVILFVSGLSFIALGFTLALQALSPIRLPGIHHLWLLAAFALTHGINEWLAMVALIASPALRGSSATALDVAGLITLFISFAFLLQFGVSTLVDGERWWPGLKAIPLLVLALSTTFLLAYGPELDGLGSLSWLANGQAIARNGVRLVGSLLAAGVQLDGMGSPAWLATGQAIARYSVGLVGSLLTAWALWRVRRTWRETKGSRVTRLLFGAVAGFALYAIFAGVIVAPAPFFPASFANTAWFIANFGFPVQVARTVCALAITYFMIRVYFFEAAHYVNVANAVEKQRVQRLEETDQIKNDFTSITGPELRTLLGNVNKGPARSLLGNINKGSAQSARSRPEAALKDEPLRTALSRIESGTLPVKSQRFRLVNSINVVSHRMANQARSRGIDLEVERDEGIELYADPSLTEEILVNLVDNAIKYSFDNTKILVRVEGREGKAVVSVHDQGPGIPAEQIQLLFGRGVRLRRPDQPARPGSGLGLYVTKRLVEMQGGEIWVESKVRKGSVFYFTLPMAKIGV